MFGERCVKSKKAQWGFVGSLSTLIVTLKTSIKRKSRPLTYQKSKPLKNPNLRSPQQWSPTKTYFSSGNSGGNQPGLTVPAIVGVVMIITSKWHGLCHEVFVVVSENDNEYTISDMEIIVLSWHWQFIVIFDNRTLIYWHWIVSIRHSRVAY